MENKNFSAVPYVMLILYFVSKCSVKYQSSLYFIEIIKITTYLPTSITETLLLYDIDKKTCEIITRHHKQFKTDSELNEIMLKLTLGLVEIRSLFYYVTIPSSPTATKFQANLFYRCTMEHCPEQRWTTKIAKSS